MRSSPGSRRRWDGSYANGHRLRSLRVDPAGPPRIPRCAQSDRCRECGNQIEWFQRSDEGPVCLHPVELPTDGVPARLRWHVSSGVAHAAGDGSPWCRLAHAAVCPAHDAVFPPDAAALAFLRRRLALNTRRLIDCGAFRPVVASAEPRLPSDVCRPARPIVQLLYVRYLAACPVDEIRCVAMTRRRERCTYPLLGPDDPTGAWILVPSTAAQGQLALPDHVMAMYDLSALPYEVQLRWHLQRCHGHGATPPGADLVMAEWEPFDPVIHSAHIHPRLPTRVRHPRPGNHT
ncbi:DUF6083 domain-containing protein [Streptomyces mirabilis]|uniref:DUF6083 domain-containing protein n=1 Tax=Streptomyces mirabilis TaxID=68239 RepID=UPI0036674FDA